MIKVKDILDYLEGLYPTDTACDFDNVGLLVGDQQSKVSGAVVALDCDINTIEFAKWQKANLIITHHPVIFEPIKTVRESDIVYMLIRENISVISMHTNLDVGDGGVNDALCDALNLKNIKPYIAEDGYKLKCGETDYKSADDFAAFIRKRLDGSVRYVDGGKPINTVLVCSGSGGGYIEDAISGGFDALVTADIKHNVFISAINSGISLFDGGHYNTENVVVKPLCEKLNKQFSDISFKCFFNKNIKSV